MSEESTTKQLDDKSLEAVSGGVRNNCFPYPVPIIKKGPTFPQVPKLPTGF